MNKKFAVCFFTFISIITFTFNCSNPVEKNDDSSEKIIVTEIMYNHGSDSLEFLEIKNVSTVNISLEGAYFSEGIQYSFPNSASIRPGEYQVLTNSRELFEKNYPGIKISGVYTGNLNNSGESIKLEIGGKKLFNIEYKDNGFWPALADGNGFSLVTIDENDPGDQNDHNDWLASKAPGGSPGKADKAVVPIPVYVNEVVVSGMTDRVDNVELYNPSGSKSIDISNWFLTDNPKAPKKYRIPAGTVMSPNSFKSFTADQFKNDIAVSINGGSIYLFSANADGTLTGFSHGLEYEDGSIGTSYGLKQNSDLHYYTCRFKQTTIGSENSEPASGELVISEIMYNPSSNGTEYLEIVNLTDSTIKLESDDIPWKVEGLSFEFPRGTEIKDKGIVLLVNYMISIDAFRKQKQIDSTVAIFQYTGNLSNSGETITIKKPGKIWADSNGLSHFSYVTVDAVSYSDNEPWPQDADGKGYSLVRKRNDLWGNEPKNWRLSESGGSPGRN